jgi:outer membrane protein insertion porin family
VSPHRPPRISSRSLASRYFATCIFAFCIIFFSLLTFAQADKKWTIELRSIQFLFPEVPPDLEKSLQQNIVSSKSTVENQETILKLFSNHPAYDGAQIFQKNQDFYVLPVQIPRYEEIKFTGLSAISKNEALQILDLRKEGFYIEADLTQAFENLKKYYEELGFYNVVILHKISVNGKKINLQIQIQENNQLRIGQIQFITKNPALNLLLRNRVKSFFKAKVDNQTFDEIIARVKSTLLKNRYYQTQLIEPLVQFNEDKTEVSLQFKLNGENQFQLYFENNKAFSEFDLLDELKLDTVSANESSFASELSLRLKSFYLSRGYARVSIEIKEAPGSAPFTQSLTFRINEESLIRIAQIDIRGSFSQEKSVYQDLINMHSNAVFQKGAYNKEGFDLGLKNMIIHLQNQGYIQAKINSTRVQYNEEKNKATLIVNLEEGPLTLIQDIRFLGVTNKNTDALTDVITLKKGSPLKLKDIESSLAMIKEYYQDLGNIEALIENEKQDLIQFSEDRRSAQVIFKIYEGPQIIVNSVVIEGNNFTKSSVIEKEIEFTVGDLLTTKKIEYSISRLRRTGYFATVEIKTLEEKTAISQRTVIIRVTERDPGLFNIGFGVTNEREITLRGYTGIGYRNLFGTGRGLSLRLEGNYNVAIVKYLENKVTLSYLEPYLFNSRVRGKANVTRSKTVTDYSNRLVTELNQFSYSIEKEFGKNILGIYEVWNLSTLKDSDIDNVKSDFVQEIATTGPIIEVDFRDDPFNPTMGTFTRASAEYSSPRIGSSRTIEYWKGETSFTHYQLVAKAPKDSSPWVWANRLRYGYLENLNREDDGGVPYDKKGFILGGRTTVRGFTPSSNDYFPKLGDNNDPTKKYFLTTSAHQYLYKSELRFPVYESFGGAVFYDGGSVEVRGLQFDDYYRDSAGISFRYNTDFGPVNLEYGWKLDRKPNEEPGAFYFSIGTY